MVSPLSVSSKILVVFCLFLKLTLAESRFHYSANCAGKDFVKFSFSQYDHCYTLQTGSAKSLYSTSGSDNGQVIGWKKKGVKNCGQSICSINRGNGATCCSVSTKSIKGATLRHFSSPLSNYKQAKSHKMPDNTVREEKIEGQEVPDKNTKVAKAEDQALADNTAEEEEEMGMTGCTNVEEIGEPFITLSDGTLYAMGQGSMGKSTAEELQNQLEAQGHPKLSEERIAELREDGFIK